MKRAKYFITCNELPAYTGNLLPETLKRQILSENLGKRRHPSDTQLSLFTDFMPVIKPATAKFIT